MKFRSELIKEAHKMTKEIKQEFNNVDYKTQFGLCLSFLIEEEKEMDIKNMKTKELIELKKEIEQELKTREKNTTKEKVIYKHDCCDCSNYHKNKYKHWIKKIDIIDDTKTNGYAFQGEFLNINNENLVEIDSYVIEVCGHELWLYKVKNDGDQNKEFLEGGTYKNMISFIKKCKEITNL